MLLRCSAFYGALGAKMTWPFASVEIAWYAGSTRVFTYNCSGPYMRSTTEITIMIGRTFEYTHTYMHERRGLPIAGALHEEIGGEREGEGGKEREGEWGKERKGVNYVSTALKG